MYWLTAGNHGGGGSARAQRHLDLKRGNMPETVTLRGLIADPAGVITEIRASGQPMLVTEYGRFIAVITPLKDGEIEQAVLPEMAREIADQARHTGFSSLNDD